MSFVTAVRDYVDFINQSYDSMSIHGNLFFLFQHTLLYLFESLKYCLFYLLSFRWISNVIYLPHLEPPISMALLREQSFFLDIFESLLRPLEAPSFLHNKFFLGFVNSLFVSLPISAIHLLAGRRLLVEGIPAGIAAGLGTIVGQSFFLASVLFGWRWLLIPWLSLEPFNYMVGLLVLLQTIYTICHAPSIKVVSWSERSTLINFFLLNLFLTWCEQSSIFQYVGNLTLTSDPSYIENFFATSRLSSLGTHALYLMGFFLGSCCFSLLFALIGLILKKWWLGLSTMTTSRLVNRLNFCFLVGVTALSLASIPYYGIDYLFTKGMGFIPQDKVFQGTVFSPAGMADTSKHLGISCNFQSLDTDATPFDGGRYLQPAAPQTFEDLNYQGEQYWTGKMDRKIYSTGGRKGKAFAKWVNLFGGGSKEVPFVDDEKPTQKNESMNIKRSLGGRQRGDSSSSLEDSLPWYSEFEENDGLATFEFEEKEESDLEELGRGFELTYQAIQDLEEKDLHANEKESEEDEESRKVREEEQRLFDDFFDQVEAGFSPLFLTETPEPTNLEKYLKKKFYENPVYHLLLRIDIDTFLARQPVSHSLTSEQEVELFQRRQAIANYYDSLRDFLYLSGDSLRDYLIEQKNETTLDEDRLQSYADHVYNHQFKGTLKVVRRLFSITLDPEENLEEERVLKFDQPLFHSLPPSTIFSSALEEVSPFFNPNKKVFLNNIAPFLERENSSPPFYAGWDEQLRRLVITTRYRPRYLASRGMRIPDKERSGDEFKEYVRCLNLFPQAEKDSKSQAHRERKENLDHYYGVEFPICLSSRKILFTAWPLPRKMAESFSNGSTTLASATDGKVAERLDQFIHPDGEYHDWEIESWPENLVGEWSDRHIIPPTRGGFVWPGSSEFPFDVKKFIPDIKKFFHQ